jgi:hypothetical protein
VDDQLIKSQVTEPLQRNHCPFHWFRRLTKPFAQSCVVIACNAVPAEHSISLPRRRHHQEMDMTGTKWKLATALGVAGAIALSVPSAEARGGRNAAIGFGIAAGALALGAAAAASQPRYGYYDNGYYGGGGPYAYQPSYVYEQPYVYDSYNYDVPTMYYGRPPNRNRQVPGTNWNPNQ